MAIDITLQVMLNVSNHALDPGPAAKRHRKGDVLHVMRTSDVADWNGTEYISREPITSPRMGFVHLREVPNDIALKIKETLQGHAHEDVYDGETKIEEITIRHRKYRIPPSVMPAAALADLLENREITGTWTQARALIRKKIVQVNLDPLQDDESQSVSDGDILG